MVLGQSAATAAAFAIDDKIDVQKVDYAKLRDEAARRQAGARLDRPEARRRHRREDAAGHRDRRRGRRAQGLRAHEQRRRRPFVGDGYRHDGNEDRGKQSATLSARPAAGRQVRGAHVVLAQPEPRDQRAGHDRPRRRHDDREGESAARRRRSTGRLCRWARFASRRARRATSRSATRTWTVTSSSTPCSGCSKSS